MRKKLRKLLTTHNHGTYADALLSIENERATLLDEHYATTTIYRTHMQMVWMNRVEQALEYCMDLPELGDHLAQARLMAPASPAITEICLRYSQILEMHREIGRDMGGNRGGCPCAVL